MSSAQSPYFDDLEHDQQLARMVKDAQLLQCFAVRSAAPMPEAFHTEFATAARDLTARLAAGPPQAPAADPLAAVESRFLHLYDRLATTTAPVTAQSIQRTLRANDRRIFFPTMLATLAAVLVFGAVIVLQGYWVLGKRFLDLAQRHDSKRQELVLKGALIEDALDRVGRRRADLPKDCSASALSIAAKSAAKPPPVEPDRIRQCALLDALKDEQFRLELEQRPPLDRERKDIADQFAPVLSMVQYLHAMSVWRQDQARDWEQPFDKEVQTMRAAARQEIDNLRAQPVFKTVALRPPTASTAAAAAAVTATSSQMQASLDYLLDQTERRINSRADIKVAEVELRRSRVLMHRVEIVLDVLKNYAVPALMGLLGALVFVLREIGTRLRSYAYVPDSLARGAGRIVVGMIAGVLAGWLVPDTETVAKSIPPLIIPFVFGYSVDILFGLLDKAAAMFSTNTAAPKPA